MFNFIAVIFILVGVYFFFFNLLGCGGDLELLSERDYTCPEKFRKNQKISDGVCAFHNATKSIFGLAILLKGIEVFKSVNLFNVNNIILVSLIFLIVDALISALIAKKYGLTESMNAIWNQWKTQKKVTDENDDEVNLYRQEKRVYTIPRDDFIYLVILTLTMFF